MPHHLLAAPDVVARGRVVEHVFHDGLRGVVQHIRFLFEADIRVGQDFIEVLLDVPVILAAVLLKDVQNLDAIVLKPFEHFRGELGVLLAVEHEGLLRSRSEVEAEIGHRFQPQRGDVDRNIDFVTEFYRFQGALVRFEGHGLGLNLLSRAGAQDLAVVHVKIGHGFDRDLAIEMFGNAVEQVLVLRAQTPGHVRMHL